MQEPFDLPAPAATIAERIRAQTGALTRTERRVAQTLLTSYPMAGLETVAKFARRARTSAPSVLRFIAKLGFPSYADFQRQLREELAAVVQSPLTRYGQVAEFPSAPKGSTAAFGRRVIENIGRAMALLSEEDVTAIVDLLAQDRRPVYLIGGRFSGAFAKWVFLMLREIRRNVHLVEGQSATWVEYLVDIDRRTVVFVFDFRRYQEDVIAFGTQAAAQGATVVAITDEWMSPVAASAAYVLTAPVAVPSLFDSTIASLAQFESIIARLGERRGQDGRDRIARIESIRAAMRK
jgi:DNA-binding MurR/RpiR family transcriptional regulator